ncbi:MAG: PAS domain S-box protein [Verrucomicrobiales bacterium]|nr:PAS domain S-box protein [Verrucomicrobiales bacterium]
MNGLRSGSSFALSTGWIVFGMVVWSLLIAAAWATPWGLVVLWPLGLTAIGAFGVLIRRRDRDLQRTRVALSASEEKYRRIFDDSLAAILLLDPQLRFIDANQAALNLFGYSREELLRRSFAEIDAGPVHSGQSTNQAPSLAQPLSGEHNLRRKDGTLIVVSGNSQTLKDSNGGVTGTLLLLVDLTETRKTEEAWQQSQRRLSLFFNQSLDGYYFSELETPQEWNENTDKDRVLDYIRSHQRITEVNDAMLAQYGASREEFLGRPVGQFFRHDMEDGRRLHRQLCDEGRLHVETCERREDGTPVWIEGDYVCIFDNQHRITGTFGVQRDITQRKQAEELRAQLESQLRHAQKLEAIGQLAGGVAHDFNNILAAMMMNFGMMRREPGLSNATRERLEEITPLMERAATLVQQLLLFARRGVMHFQVVDLRELLLHLLQMLRRLIGEHIRLQFPGYPSPVWVRADPGMIEQVVTNLVVNARDALPSGGQIDLTLDLVEVSAAHSEIHSEARPGSFVRLSVRDTGTGMDETVQRKLFEPFFTTKEIGKGTGLGLSTVRGIVQQHEGWIEVDSAPGRGSTFCILLPAAAPPQLQSAPEPTGSPAALPRGHHRILLVEDEPTLRHAVAHVLERQGFQVLQAGEGKEALRLWDAPVSNVDLLLTDVVMPEGMDGLELARLLRRSRPDLPVILMTGYSAELLKPGFEVPPGTHFLQKPCGPHELIDTIRQALEKS